MTQLADAPTPGGTVTDVAVPPRTGRRTPWFLVLLLAAPICALNVFLLVSLEGSVGYIGRADEPFAQWVRHSVVVLPLYVAAVALTLAVIRRRTLGRRPRRATATGLLALTLVTSALGLADVAANSAYDYHRQSIQLQDVKRTHFTAPIELPGQVSTQATGDGSCDVLCQQLRQTLSTHLRALSYVALVLLASNLFLVGWVVAARGGRLDGPRPARRRPTTA